ncbi:MAG: sigma-70 family RNA polymerase sigma factor [Candidatus Pacearchaeota archaeon]
MKTNNLGILEAYLQSYNYSVEDSKNALNEYIKNRDRLKAKINEYYRVYGKNGASPKKLKNKIVFFTRAYKIPLKKIEYRDKKLEELERLKEKYRFLTRKNLENKIIFFEEYFKEKKIYNRLEELKKLKEKYDSSKQRLFLCNIKLLIHRAQKIYEKYKYSFIDLHDMIEEGFIGFNDGSAVYDPKKGTSFSTHICRWIDGYILRAINKYHPFMTINIRTRIKELNTAVEKYKSQGKVPTLDEISKKMNCNKNVAARISEIVLNPLPISLDHFIDEDEKMTLEDKILIKETEKDSLSEKEVKQFFKKYLPKKYADILIFSLVKDYTLQKIGNIMHLSRERIRQIKNKALKKIKEPLKKLINL